MKSVFFRCLILLCASYAVFAQDIVDLSPKPGAKYPIPENCREKEVFEIVSNEFTSVGEVKKFGVTITDDSEAADGKAMSIGIPWKQEDPAKFHSQDFTMGIAGRTSSKTLSFVRLKKDQILQDEKYHFYSLGKVILEPKTLFFGHPTWYLQQDLSRWYKEDGGDRNKVEVLVSLKFTGPAYVKNSKKENGISLDRILLVRH